MADAVLARPPVEVNFFSVRHLTNTDQMTDEQLEALLERRAKSWELSFSVRSVPAAADGAEWCASFELRDQLPISGGDDGVRYAMSATRPTRREALIGLLSADNHEQAEGDGSFLAEYRDPAARLPRSRFTNEPDDIRRVTRASSLHAIVTGTYHRIGSRRSGCSWTVTTRVRELSRAERSRTAAIRLGRGTP